VRYLLASENIKWAVSDYASNLNEQVIDGQRDAAEILEQWMVNEASSLDTNGDMTPYTYSLLDLAQIEQVRIALDALTAELSPTVGMTRTLVTEALSATDFFDIDADGSIDPFNAQQPDNYADLASFARALQEQFPDNSPVVAAAGQIRAAVDAVHVVDPQQLNGKPLINGTTGAWQWDELGGLSVYMPLPHDHWKRRYYQERHFAFVEDSTWESFLSTYHERLPPPEAPACPPECGSGLPRLSTEATTLVYLPLVQR
jgi:hypothetical protein